MANLCFQNALKRVPQNIPPVWFMRQAGRYHQHYQALRKQHTFMEMCKDADLAAEVAMGPIEDFDFDLAILFSDLLFPLEAMGMGLEYNPAPTLGWQLNDDTISKLRSVNKSSGAAISESGDESHARATAERQEPNRFCRRAMDLVRLRRRRFAQR